MKKELFTDEEGFPVYQGDQVKGEGFALVNEGLPVDLSVPREVSESEGGVFIGSLGASLFGKVWKVKFCGPCQEIKPASDFYKNHRTSDGLFAKCKKCQKSSVNKKPVNPYRFY